MMKKQIYRILSVALICLLLLSLCSCGEASEYSVKGTKENGKTVWYLGANNIMSEVKADSLFKDFQDKIDPSQIYSAHEIKEDMLQGAFTLDNKEKELKKIKKEIPFEDVNFSNTTANIIPIPVAVYLGAEYVSTMSTGYEFADFEQVTDVPVAVISFATADSIGHISCIYEINGRKITFKEVDSTNAIGEPIEYEASGLELTYDFEIKGPYLTLSKGNSSIQLKSYCFTENVDDLSMSGYSLPSSPLVNNIDYFSAATPWNYAVTKDGSYIDLSAYKLDDEGRFSVYFKEKDYSSDKTEEFIEQYAYIVQSDSGNLLPSFKIVLLDSSKVYYYTDDILLREKRALKDQGADIKDLTEEEIKEIAEKKSDLFDDLYQEFSSQNINVIINRATGEIAMDASVLFGGDSADITADGKNLINKFLKVYTSIIYNEKYDGFISKTLIEGHTAPVAGSTYESGLPLSQQRADNVKDYCLSSETGISQDYISELTSSMESVGLSNSKPVIGSDGNVNMTDSRRVSFRFLINLD